MPLRCSALHLQWQQPQHQQQLLRRNSIASSRISDIRQPGAHRRSPSSPAPPTQSLLTWHCTVHWHFLVAPNIVATCGAILTCSRLKVVVHLGDEVKKNYEEMGQVRAIGNKSKINVHVTPIKSSHYDRALSACLILCYARWYQTYNVAISLAGVPATMLSETCNVINNKIILIPCADFIIALCVTKTYSQFTHVNSDFTERLCVLKR